jgi:hypothetical protein
MRFFIDTEFIESGPHKPIDLISIGIVAEDGREYYAVSSEYDHATASQWVADNVLSHIPEGVARKRLPMIGMEIIKFVFPECPLRFDKPEFWGYYADYDWVVFCQIFGSMVDLPKGFPMYLKDLKQLCVSLGNPTLPKQSSTEHNALHDARWNRDAYLFLEDYAMEQSARKANGVL